MTLRLESSLLVMSQEGRNLMMKRMLTENRKMRNLTQRSANQLQGIPILIKIMQIVMLQKIQH